jgi:nucleoside 2-deoxyribosyltransferase
MKSIYLCGGIHGLSYSEANDWRSEAKEVLGLNYALIDPFRRDYRGKEVGNEDIIVRQDLFDIAACDILLANATRPSWGTGMEIFHAHTTGKHVVAVAASDSPGRNSPWLNFHAIVLPSFGEAYGYLLERRDK